MSLSFREELRDTSLSLDELLRKHQLDLESAFREHKPVEVDGHTSTNEPNITFTNNAYNIIKSVHNKQEYYGRYNTLEEAVLVRDKLKEFNWDKDRLGEACTCVGVHRKNYGNEMKRPWCKYTLWDSGKARYNRGPKRANKRFRVLYSGDDVNIGCFHDPYTCELIHDLINKEVE